MVSAFFALPLVELADSVDLPDDFSVDVDAFFRLELFFFEHGEMQHFILDF